MTVESPVGGSCDPKSERTTYAATRASDVMCAERGQGGYVGNEGRVAFAVEHPGTREAMKHVSPALAGVLWVVSNARRWSDDDIIAVAAKLKKIDCCTIVDLYTLLSCGLKGINKRLKAHGELGFTQRTYSAFCQALEVHVSDSKRAHEIFELMEKMAEDDVLSGSVLGVLVVVGRRMEMNAEEFDVMVHQIAALKVGTFDDLSRSVGEAHRDYVQMSLEKAGIQYMKQDVIHCLQKTTTRAAASRDEWTNVSECKQGAIGSEDALYGPVTPGAALFEPVPVDW
eukprot:TRINITY_DN71557_c0_g1_i1.p1 TRINITY_DN71557_c0_g1~~TRINITY_DN71557_c0_g1_i1.p1  ORF type:complete len:312 (+),score=101.89 TRINITY_DN71557_c0_g1_i1:85-936(+)